MLVEDDNNLREIYEARLQAEGYVIISAKDGEEALVIAKAEKPDLIISDVMMPKISGFEMLDILRNTEELKKVKVIMLTALGQSDDQQRADRLGADRYLVKSQVTLEDIVKVTHDLLGDGEATTASPASAAPVTPASSVTPPAAPQPATDAGSSGQSPPTPPTSMPAEPGTNLSAAQAGTGKVAQSTAREEAEVEAQIEDFVSGATQEATPPAGEKPSPETPPVTEEFVAGATPEEKQPDEPLPTTVTVKTPPDAVEAETPIGTKDTGNSTSGTDTNTAASPSQDTSIVPQPAPSPPVDKPTADGASTSGTAGSDADKKPAPEPVQAPPIDSNTNNTVEAPDSKEADSSNSSVPIAHKKVITPLVGEPKKDLDTLLALDEAKQAATQAPPPPTAIISTNETGITSVPLASEPKPSDAAEPINPNSIAL